MDTEKVRNYCLKKEGSTEGTPFGDNVLVYKIADKIFCLLNLDAPCSLNLKCDPELAVELREEYEAVRPGYHMNKNHWNTILLDGSIPDKTILGWIDHSCNLIIAGLSKKQKAAISKRK